MSKQKDKTCVPVVPQATEEQRETLHRKAIGKQHKETHVEYEIFLRYGDEDGEFFVDVRKDVVDSDGDIVSEYIEGEIFDDYDEAKKKANQFEAFFAESIAEIGDQVNYYDEVEDDRD